MKQLSDRFWAKVTPAGPDSCWIWVGAVGKRGYGHFRIGRKVSYAHRVSYELMIGSIPEGLILDHLCSVRNCVNPYHLDPVTYAVNTARSAQVTTLGQWQLNKTHCPARHEYTPDNLVKKKSTYRDCRTCDNARSRRNYHARKAVSA